MIVAAEHQTAQYRLALLRVELGVTQEPHGKWMVRRCFASIRQLFKIHYEWASYEDLIFSRTLNFLIGSGPTSVEYAVMLALIVAMYIMAVSTMAPRHLPNFVMLLSLLVARSIVLLVALELRLVRTQFLGGFAVSSCLIAFGFKFMCDSYC